jgi:hypothetical protein
LRRTTTCRASGDVGTDEIKQVGALGLVELQSPRDAFQDVL